MDITNIGEFIINNGIAVVVVIYFLWKDSKLTKENTEILNQVKTLLQIMATKEGINTENKIQSKSN